MCKIKVILVDDNKSLLEVMEELINQQEDMEVISTAINGLEAIKKIEELKPDVTILDLVMPDMDGISLLETTQNEKGKFIVISALGHEYVTQKISSLGVSYFLIKPFDMNTLLKRIREVAKFESNSNSKESKGSEDQFEEKFAEKMRKFGIPMKVKGYRYIKEAIKIARNNMEISGTITKKLYPEIAKTFNSTPSRVERAIRHAIEISSKTDAKRELLEIFGKRKDNKPTNGEFIAYISEEFKKE